MQLRPQFYSIQSDQCLANIFNTFQTVLAVVGDQDCPRYEDGYDKCIKYFLLKKNSGLKPLAKGKIMIKYVRVVRQPVFTWDPQGKVVNWSIFWNILDKFDHAISHNGERALDYWFSMIWHSFCPSISFLQYCFGNSVPCETSSIGNLVITSINPD